MSNAKHKYVAPPPWLIGDESKRNRREPFVQLYSSLFEHPHFQKLSFAERYEYLCMCMEARGKRDFEFPQHTAKRYGISATSHSRIVKRLTSEGFIHTLSGRTTRECNIYTFSSDWKYR